jgi:hypothetical protein
MGFRATDEDDDTPGQVVDGVASTREPSPAELNEAFVDLCSSLRSMGCCEVRAGEFRAVWPVQPASPVVKLPAEAVLRAAKPKPKEEPLPEKVLDTDTPDDAHRRAEYQRIQRAIGGRE